MIENMLRKNGPKRKKCPEYQKKHREYQREYKRKQRLKPEFRLKENLRTYFYRSMTGKNKFRI